MSAFMPRNGLVTEYHVATAPIERAGIFIARRIGPFASKAEAESAAAALAAVYPLSPPSVIRANHVADLFDHAEAERHQLRARADLVALLAGISSSSQRA